MKRRAPVFLSSVCLAAMMGGAVLAQTPNSEEPLSAIDWLSDSVEVPAALAPLGEPVLGTQAIRTPPSDEEPVTDSASVPQVSAMSLDAPSPDGVGLLSSDTTGLPADQLWSGSEEAILVALIGAERIDTLPAIQELLTTLMLAEADPPFGAGPDGDLFLARVDKLLDLGALQPAQALLEAAEPDTPRLFRRWFDVSLLTGTEAQACDVMQNRPAVAPTAAARVFCLARSGDWSAAALTLNTAQVLGDIDPETGDLLARFLDPDLFEGKAALPPPSRPSPLVFRMREAIGEALPTTNLPRAFAHADLRPTTGWKAQIEAAERLSRFGAVSDNILQATYTARVPAASGGVWERAKAVQALEAALAEADEGEIADTLETAWARMGEAGLRPALAGIFGESLSTATLTGDAADLRFDLLMLTDKYELAALDLAGEDDGGLLGAVARGDVAPDMSASAKAAPVRDAFATPTPDAALVEMASQGRLGEALLRTIAAFELGMEGDGVALAESLSTLRALGLEDVARRAALQFLVLEDA